MTDKVEYNLSALMGAEVTDQDYVDSFNAPQELVNTPAINDWMLDTVEEQNVAAFLETGKDVVEAQAMAAENKKAVKARINELMAKKGYL